MSDDLGDGDGDDDDDDEDYEEDEDKDGSARNKAANGADEADDSQLEDSRRSQQAVTENEPNPQHDTETGSDQPEIKVEASNEGMDAIRRSNGISKPSPRAKAVGQAAKLRKDLKDKAKIANLFAEAMRLKQEAAKREAEAYELQAKMLVAEAKQLE